VVFIVPPVRIGEDDPLRPRIHGAARFIPAYPGMVPGAEPSWGGQYSAVRRATSAIVMRHRRLQYLRHTVRLGRHGAIDHRQG